MDRPRRRGDAVEWNVLSCSGGGYDGHAAGDGLIVTMAMGRFRSLMFLWTEPLLSCMYMRLSNTMTIEKTDRGILESSNDGEEG
jgi:hypothetical protein